MRIKLRSRTHLSSIEKLKKENRNSWAKKTWSYREHWDSLPKSEALTQDPSRTASPAAPSKLHSCHRWSYHSSWLKVLGSEVEVPLIPVPRFCTPLATEGRAPMPQPAWLCWRATLPWRNARAMAMPARTSAPGTTSSLPAEDLFKKIAKCVLKNRYGFVLYIFNLGLFGRLTFHYVSTEYQILESDLDFGIRKIHPTKKLRLLLHCVWLLWYFLYIVCWNNNFQHNSRLLRYSRQQWCYIIYCLWI